MKVLFSAPSRWGHGRRRVSSFLAALPAHHTQALFPPSMAQACLMPPSPPIGDNVTCSCSPPLKGQGEGGEEQACPEHKHMNMDLPVSWNRKNVYFVFSLGRRKKLFSAFFLVSAFSFSYLVSMVVVVAEVRIHVCC